MTIRMLIVDDEPIICEGLRNTIPWADAGVEVIGEAYDGEEALRMIAERGADLVLTDICMTGMDGLELAKELKKTMPHVRVVIVSGYDEFEYARQALRLGIEDYLLKPVNVDELVGMIRRISADLMREREKARERRTETRENLLRLLLRGEPVLPELEKLAAEGMTSYRIVASQMEDYAVWAERLTEGERRTVRDRWKREVESALGNRGFDAVSFYDHPNLLITLCMGRNEIGDALISGILSEVLLRGVEQGTEGLHENGKCTQRDSFRFYFGVSALFASLRECRVRCQEAIRALQYRVVSGSRSILFYENEIRRERPNCRLFTPEMEKRLNRALIQGDGEAVLEVLQGMMMQFRDNGYLLREMVQAYDEMRTAIVGRLRSGGAEVEKEALLDTSAIDLHEHNSYDAVEKLILQDMSRLVPVIHSSGAVKHHWFVERAKKYIVEQNRYDLKASEVAAWLKITPSYFSLIFKQHVGRSFAEYVNELRIEQAKTFLAETHDRVFEIADRVGYKEYKYFVTVFKSFTGMTPTEYRKLASGTRL